MSAGSNSRRVIPGIRIIDLGASLAPLSELLEHALASARLSFRGRRHRIQVMKFLACTTKTLLGGLPALEYPKGHPASRHAVWTGGWKNKWRDAAAAGISACLCDGVDFQERQRP
jgi:hypothetical protein